VALEQEYPVFRDEIVKARGKGIGEDAIRARIDQYVGGLKEQGYEDDEIETFLKTVPAPTPSTPWSRTKERFHAGAGEVVKAFTPGPAGYWARTKGAAMGAAEMAVPSVMAGEIASQYIGEPLARRQDLSEEGIREAVRATERGDLSPMANVIAMRSQALLAMPEEQRREEWVREGGRALGAGVEFAAGFTPATAAATSLFKKVARAQKVSEIASAERSVQAGQQQMAATAVRQEATEAKPVEELVKQEKVVEHKGAYAPNLWSNETLLDAYVKSVARGEIHRPEVVAEVARRSNQDAEFRTTLTQEILNAKRAIEESKAVAERAEGTVGQKVVKELSGEMRKLGTVRMKDMTPDELSAAAVDITRKMNLMESKGLTGSAEYARLGEIQNRITKERLARQESSVGAMAYRGDVNLPPHVQRAIHSFEKIAIEGGPLHKVAAQAVAELRANHRLSDKTARSLGLERATPSPSPMVQTEVPAPPPALEKPPKGVVQTVVKAGAEPAVIVRQPATVEVTRGGQPTGHHEFEDILQAQEYANRLREQMKGQEGLEIRVNLRGETVSTQAPPAKTLVNVYKSGRLANQYETASFAEAEEMTNMIKEAVGQHPTPEIYRVEIAPATPAAPKPTRTRARKAEVEETTARPPQISEAQAIQEGLAVRGAPEAPPPPPAPAYSLSSVKLLADAKGVRTEVNTKGDLLIRLTMPDGQVHQTASLKEATQFLMKNPDKAKASAIDKALDGKPLTDADRKEINRFAGDELTPEPKETDVPHPSSELIPEAGPPENPGMPEISGGAGASLTTDNMLLAVAANRGYGPAKTTEYLTTMTRLFGEHPHLEPWFRNEMSAIRGRTAFKNPADYLSMPQFSSNAGIRTITMDALMNHALPKGFELRKWIDYYNKWWGNLSPGDRRDIWLAMRGRKAVDKLSEDGRAGYEAAKAFTEDVGTRLGVGSDWARYLTGLIDHEANYKGWRAVLTSFDNWAAVPPDFKEKLGHNPNTFEMVKRAMDKHEQYKDLPKSVKRILDKELIPWYDKAKYEQLPQFIRDMVPEDAWSKFSMTGGMPLIEDWNATFRGVLPVILDKLYTKPWEAKWRPLWESLPGGSYGPVTKFTTRAYLQNWWTHARGGAERSGISEAVDGLIEQVEEKLAVSLTNPDWLGNLAKAAGRNVYASTLGAALDSGTLNLFQNLNTWAETGRVTRGMMARMMSSDRQALVSQVPGGVGILEEMAWHTMHKTGDELAKMWGLPRDRFLAFQSKVQELAMSPMHIAEFINRGVAFNAGLDEALAMGLDAQTAMYMGFARQSRVIPSLHLSPAMQHALGVVARTQFGYQPVMQSPYMQGPLMKASTLFWSYPTKQFQFLSNGIARSLYATFTGDSKLENFTRSIRYSLLTGMYLAGPTAAVAIGVNLENAFSPNSILPKAATPTLQPLMTMYNMILGRDPISQRDWDQMWKNFIHMIGIPGYRFGKKSMEVYQNLERGHSVNAYGKKMYEVTPWGEYTRLFGFEAGRTFQERMIVRKDIENGILMRQERENAISAAVTKGDVSGVERFNKRWGGYGPSTAITGEDLANWARGASMTAIQRRRTSDTIQGTMQEYGYTP
jgi:hypothetical protein